MTIVAIPTKGVEIKTSDFKKYFYFLGTYVLDGFDITTRYQRLGVYVGTGSAKINGIIVEITAQEELNGLAANVKNYAYLELTYDAGNEITGARLGSNTDRADSADRVYIAEITTDGNEATTFEPLTEDVAFTDMAGNLLAAFRRVDNAENCVRLHQSAGNDPVTVEPAGNAANLDIVMRGKGTGRATLEAPILDDVQNMEFEIEALASNEIDFDGKQFQTRAIAANTTFTAVNMGEGAMKTIKLLCGAASATLTFPDGWIFMGSKPAEIAANKTAVLTLVCFGDAETDVVAAYAAEA